MTAPTLSNADSASVRICWQGYFLGDTRGLPATVLETPKGRVDDHSMAACQSSRVWLQLADTVAADMALT
jgi:hypothetical protein